MPANDPPADEVVPKLASLRMFLTVFTFVQFVVAGVVVFSINKMNFALVPHPAAPFVALGVAGVLAAVVAVVLPPVTAAVRRARRDEPERFARFTSEALVRAFLLNAPAVVLLIGYVLTAKEWLLVPAAVGLLVVWFMRPTRTAYERWSAAVG